MEKELNIAAILKEKPEGTKLWSPIIGDCTFNGINPQNSTIVAAFTDRDGEEKCWDFAKSGRTLSAQDTAEVCLFPSKQMRDWSKFAWKKGDVLVNACGFPVLFEKWENDEYTSFYAKTKDLGKSFWYETDAYSLASEEKSNVFFEYIEAKYGGKLNLSTLEIEKPEFKDGDIVFVDSPFIGIHTKSMIAILNKDTDDGCEFYLALCNKDYDDCTSLRVNPITFNRMQAKKVRPATDSEKQQLFDALAKEGKRWNPETKQIEDLPKKCEFKAFDKVLVRDTLDEAWVPSFFSNMDREGEEYLYGCISGNTIVVYNKYCIPYNEETAHLLGTTDDYKQD